MSYTRTVQTISGLLDYLQKLVYYLGHHSDYSARIGHFRNRYRFELDILCRSDNYNSVFPISYVVYYMVKATSKGLVVGNYDLMIYVVSS